MDSRRSHKRQADARWRMVGVNQLNLRVLRHHGAGLPRRTSAPIDRGGCMRPWSIALTLPVFDGWTLVVRASVLLAVATFQGVALPI